MLEFCPECDNLLRKKVLGGREFLACRCGYKKETGGQASSAGVRFILEKDPPRKAKVKTVSWDPPEASMLYTKLKNIPENTSPVILKMIQDKLDTRYYTCTKCAKLMSANLFCTLHEKKVGKKDICKSFDPVHSGLGAKKVINRSNDDKNGSASKANQRCGMCIFYQDKFCHAHKKAVTTNGASCDDFEYIFERSDELLRKKD